VPSYTASRSDDHHGGLDVVGVEWRRRQRPQEERIGVEFTEATHEDYVATMMLPEARQEGSVVDRSLFEVGVRRRGLAWRRKVASQKQLTGPGWEGDAPEREWAEGVIAAVEAKTDKLLRHYERYDEDWLLVYDNLHLPGVKLGRAGDLLRARLEPFWKKAAFGVVAIDSGEEISLVDSTSARRLPVRDLWRDAGAAGE
jgi:hypothetical protein